MQPVKIEWYTVKIMNNETGNRWTVEYFTSSFKVAEEHARADFNHNYQIIAIEKDW